MSVTKTPSLPCITIKLSDLMTIVDEVLPLAGLDQVLLTISPLWEFQIIFPRRREPHAVYGKGVCYFCSTNRSPCAYITASLDTPAVHSPRMSVRSSMRFISEKKGAHYSTKALLTFPVARYPTVTSEKFLIG